MTIKFNDTQLVLLSAASQRDDHCLVPPTGPKGGQALKVVAKLLQAGLVKEIRAKAGAPIWRRDDETGQTFALKLTAAGAKARGYRAVRRRGGLACRPSDRLRRSEERTRFRPSGSHRRTKQRRRPEPDAFTAEAKSRRSSHCCSAATARRSPSLSPPPAGCRTRRGPRSPGCASAATPSGLIGPTRREDRSIGSRRSKGATIAGRRTLRRRRVAKRRIRPSAPRICEPVGLGDGQGSERRGRGISRARVVVVRA